MFLLAEGRRAGEGACRDIAILLLLVVVVVVVVVVWVMLLFM